MSAVSRLKSVFGTTYHVQGSSALTDIPKALFRQVRSPNGRRRRSILSSAEINRLAAKAIVGIHFRPVSAVWLSTQIVVCLDGIYLIGFNLAFSTYAFVDVVADALMVES